jgi:selenocysteine lyase/cysteine desulfurase
MMNDMNSQKSLFQIPEGIHYLNCAYMSPLLKSVEEAGIRAMQLKRNPIQISPQDFFAGAEMLRENFGSLVNCAAQQVAIIPSASYGLSTAVRNLPTNNGNKAIVVADEFPSGYYTIEKWCRENNKQILTVKPPIVTESRGKAWNHAILDAIDSDTAVVVMSSIHWADGTMYDLRAIGQKCKENNALFIVDGTQSVGALPIDVSDFQIDALVCAGYKWLMGPYSIGVAYYSEIFNGGEPLEESWMTRSNAQDFANLTKYVDTYSPGAGRYNVGEFSNFILVPMLNASIQQILEWGVENIQNYCDQLSRPMMRFFHENGFGFEEGDYRAKHLFGVMLPQELDREKLLQHLKEKQIYVSVRGEGVRISLHLFNTEADLEALIIALRDILAENR